MARDDRDDVVREPENSTVDDWFGQNVARDQEVADRVSAEEDDPADAEAAFDEQAHGEERYAEGHPRPAGSDRTSQT
ncbi:MAG: hypothetical protein JWM89_3629 [Acidimicrobiales bacterium]|nr:hypothetical protein [Acidimicrobiales bacterium]